MFSKGENTIGSHVIYKRKLDGRPMERIESWGHRDRDKDCVRGDPRSVRLEVLHLLLSIAAELKWSVVQRAFETALL